MTQQLLQGPPPAVVPPAVAVAGGAPERTAPRPGSGAVPGRRPGPTGPGADRPRRRVLRPVVAVVLVVAVVVLVAAQRSVLTGAVGLLGHADWRWLPAVLAAELASKTAVARAHRRLLAATGTPMAARTVLAVTYAGNAVSMTLPVAGAQLSAAFTFRELTRRGASPAGAAWTLLVSGVAATSAFAVLALIGAATATAGPGGTVIAAAGALLGAVPAWAVVVLVRRRSARARLVALTTRLLGHLLRRPGRAARAARDVLDQLGALRLAPRTGAAVLGLALANWLTDALCLAAAVAVVGAPVPWAGLLLAFLATAGASSLALTPGGLGTVEVVLTAALVTAGLDAPHAVGATLVYRLVTLWLATAGGWVVYAGLRRRR